ncbi:exopolysaccharide biosynthesis polyprenyl glycosylphosphotransferase [Lachnospiraceae bacterium]|nr:exopolysaccharide biosynthesis polyprenyl glycosylphosphotransferase [Lachnospiraceae bacterium]
MKEQLRQCENLIVLLFKVILYFLVFWSFYGLFAIRNWQLLSISRTAAVTILSYLISGYLFIKIYGGYDIGKRKSKPIVISLSLAAFMTDMVAYVMLMVMNTNNNNNIKFTLEQPWLILVVCALQIIVIEFAVYGGNWVYFKIYDPEKCLIVTSSQRSLNEISKSIKKYKLQFKICRNIDYRNEALRDIIPKYDTIFVYDVPVKERTQIVEFCYQNMKNVYINPEMADVVELNSHHVMLDDVSLLELSSMGLTAEQKFVKRAFDIILSVFALVITSPLVLISAIAIKIEDGGTVFFKQNRATRGGKIFSVYKLRTMKENVDNYLSVVDDERITKVGKVLRRFRIDEIPQFLNVIKGDMSVVGPRPEILANIFNYTNALPEFEYRLRVKAGITGYAQIAGKYNTLPKDKLVLDLMYIEDYSLWLDIKLIFQTLIVIFKKDSTEAFDREVEERMDHYSETYN